ncbi:hypothetical protein RF55_7436 [Lasius niger]|uniref:Uncharacterized protein n=1 Tax=Lasius niger TaxID=67767 RepID=A0A0J7KQP8_LASNI|nr:hypothetical protein RF55_7436 [Lasius niger]
MKNIFSGEIGVQEEETGDISQPQLGDDPQEESSSQVEACASGTQEVTQEEDVQVNICVFCTYERKRHQGRFQNLFICQKDGTIEKIKSNAILLNDTDLFQRIESLLSQKRFIYYHSNCKKAYKSKCESHRAALREKTDWHKKRDMHSIAYNEVCSFINKNVIDKKRCYFYNFLEKMYTDCLTQEYERIGIFSGVLPSCHLEDKLLNTFNQKIAIITMNKQKLVKPYAGVLLQDNDLIKLEKEDIVARAALILREEIRTMESNKLPNQLTANDLIKGECSVPNMLTEFYSTLLGSTSYRRKRSSQCHRIANSFAQDVIYAVSNGRIKPSKHISLGMALKGLTNSKKIVNIINKYGHCCSYTVLEELETEATFSSSSRSDICPEDILRSSNLCTSVAFNNFDRFVDTTSGKGTLHDTVGIIFQHLNGNAAHIIECTQDNENYDEASASEDNEHQLRGTRQGRYFHITGPEQVRPSNFSAELKNINFKDALVHFLVDSWAVNEMAPFIGNKTVYVNYDSCYKYEVINGEIVRTVDEDLSCPEHEEADTKIIYHVCQIVHEANVLIRCSDTDILVIMLGNMQFVKAGVKIWMDVSVGNTQRHINVTELHKNLGDNLCTSLPAFHALTDCDFNPTFFRKGKNAYLTYCKALIKYKHS